MNAFQRLFDSFAAPFFKVDPEGRHAYFPAGHWSAGYVLPDAAAAERLRRTVRRLYMGFFLIGIPVFTQLIRLDGPADLPWLAVWCVGIGIGFHLVLRWLAWGLPRSDMRLSLEELRARQSLSLGRGWLITMIIVSILLIGLGVAVLAIGGEDNLWVGGLLIAMFVGCLVVFVSQLRNNSRDGQNGRPPPAA